MGLKTRDSESSGPEAEGTSAWAPAHPSEPYIILCVCHEIKDLLQIAFAKEVFTIQSA